MKSKSAVIKLTIDNYCCMQTLSQNNYKVKKVNENMFMIKRVL